jgi:hypothetical protein
MSDIERCPDQTTFESASDPSFPCGFLSDAVLVLENSPLNSGNGIVPTARSLPQGLQAMPFSQPSETRRKFFTVAEANKALPLVRAIVGDIVRQYQTVVDLKQRLSDVSRSQQRGSRRRPQPDIYAEELAQTEATLEAEEIKLREFIEELEKLGVELKDADGLCDFPACKDGREIYLCWRLGEPEILFWHEIQDGYAGRQPLSELAVTSSGPR